MKTFPLFPSSEEATKEFRRRIEEIDPEFFAKARQRLNHRLLAALIKLQLNKKEPYAADLLEFSRQTTA